MASVKTVPKNEDEVRAVERDDWTYNLSGDLSFQEFVSKYDNGVGVSGNFVGYMYNGSSRVKEDTSYEDGTRVYAKNVETIRLSVLSPDTDKEVTLRVRSDLEMEKVKGIYERLFGMPEKSVVFQRKGAIVCDEATPISLSMYEGDEIHAFYIEDLSFHFNLEECFCRRHIHYRLLEQLIKEEVSSGSGSAEDSGRKELSKQEGSEGKDDLEDDDSVFPEGLEDETEFLEEEEELEEGEDYDDSDDDYVEEYVDEDDVEGDEYADEDDDIEEVDDDEPERMDKEKRRPSGKTIPEGVDQ